MIGSVTSKANREIEETSTTIQENVNHVGGAVADRVKNSDVEVQETVDKFGDLLEAAKERIKDK